jgi:hypothetical protein
MVMCFEPLARRLAPDLETPVQEGFFGIELG